MDCDKCRALVTPTLIGACASVGIEAKRSTAEMVASYLREKHRDHVPRLRP